MDHCDVAREGAGLVPSSLLLQLGLICLALATPGCTAEEESEVPAGIPYLKGDLGRYWTSADGMFDSYGRQMLLRGVNFPTQQEEPDDFARVAGWGMKVIRQLYFWADVEPVEGAYDEQFLAELDRQIERAGDQGLYVLLDMHQHCYGEGFDAWGLPAWTCDEQYYQACEDDPWNYFCDGMETCFELFWSQEQLKQKYIDHLVMLAERYAGEPQVIGFDLMNEPFCSHAGLDGCGEVMGAFFSEAAAQINQVAPDMLFFFEPNYIELLGLATALPPLSLPNKGVYGAHYYLMEVHDGGDYDLDSEPISHAVQMRKDEAVAFDVPLFMGEFGGMASVANFDQYIDDNLDVFDRTLSGSTYWLYARGDGFHLLDSEGEEKSFVDTFVRPYPQLTPGLIQSLSFDSETLTMVMIFDGYAAVGEPGALFVPRRHYGTDFSFSGCDAPSCSWEYDQETGLINFAIHADGRYTLQLSPG